MVRAIEISAVANLPQMRKVPEGYFALSRLIPP